MSDFTVLYVTLVIAIFWIVSYLKDILAELHKINQNIVGQSHIQSDFASELRSRWSAFDKLFHKENE